MVKDSLSVVLSAKAKPLLRDWLVLTWFRDVEKIGPAPRSVWNWTALAVWAGLTYLWATTIPLYLGGFAVLAFLYTLGRSHRVMTARRTLVGKIVDSTRQVAGHPRSTTQNPVDPDALVTVRRWGRKNLPTRVDVTFTPESPAGLSPLSRGQLETIIDKLPNPYTASAGGWVYEIVAKTGRLRAEAVQADDSRLDQQREIAYLRKKFVEWFKITDKQLKTYAYDLDIPEWTELDHPQRGTVPVPGQIVFTYDGHNTAGPDGRDRLERACDNELVRGDLVWIYDWTTPGQLVITGAGPDSVPAKRKLAQRWVSDLVAGQTARASKDAAVATVTGWQEEAHGDPATPIAFTADYGSGAFTSRTNQRLFEDAADEALATTYPSLVWVYDWTVSATTSVDAQAFPPGHIAALRKSETKRLREVVEQHFGQRGNKCDLEVLEWEPCDTENPHAQPVKIKVKFGSININKPGVTEDFEDHFDAKFVPSEESTVVECDWDYSWRTDAGYVLLTAVPPLPPYIAFPATGTREFERFLALAREGKILYGPRRRGGEVIQDFAAFPHSLIGGQTGSGKSYALGLPLFAALYQPDYLECVVLDPKKMDFTWTQEFPNVLRFGAEDQEIADCIEFIGEQMEYRQQRCGRRGVRNLQELRDLYVRHPEYEKDDGPCPRRMLVFFDEVADYLAKSGNKDIEEIKQVAKGVLEKLARLARALEINLITAAQKPAGDIISTQLRSQLGYRMCVGPADTVDTSKQIILDNHGMMFPKSGNPKGRAWAYDSKDGYRMTQVMFLPNDTQPAPWDTSIIIEGAKERIRARLRQLGYQPVKVPNQYGGQDDRWVLVEPVETDSDAPESATGESTVLPSDVPDPAETDLVTVPSATADSDWGDNWD